MLAQIGTTYTLAIDDNCAEKYQFMQGFERIRNLKLQPLQRIYNRIAALDVGSLPRMGAAQECIGPATKILNIDHHWTGSHFAHINLIDVYSSATSEILYDLCNALKLEITPMMAEALFVGILTDTGRFRFANTTARAMQICADLAARGVDAARLTERIYFDHPFETMRALTKALASLELYSDGQVSLMSLDMKDLVDDTEGFVEYGVAIKGVKLAAFLCEIGPDLWKVSLRSRCEIDVSVIAINFGGGGHLKAAGFRRRSKKDTLKTALLKAFEASLNSRLAS